MNDSCADPRLQPRLKASGRGLASRAAGVLILALASQILGAQESRARFPAPIDDGEASINAEDILKHLEFLASDDMKGRRTGSDEEKLAADYITKHFETCGLKPAGEGKGWTQKFRAITFTGTNV